MNPYVGEIRIFAGTFAPAEWSFCDGRLLSIADFAPLYQLIGTTYGGDGQTTFNLPNLQGRIPFHQGSSFILGQLSGTENVTLTTSQLPIHTHSLAASSAAGAQTSPAGGLWAQSTLDQFSTEANSHTMDPSAIVATGGSQPHDNMPPFLVINFIISLYGIFPSQN